MSTRTMAQWTADLHAATAGRQLSQELFKVLVWAALKAEREAKLGQRTAGLHTRSGAMIQRTSAIARMVSGGGEVVLRVTVPYGSTHEHGETIRPRRGKYLTIPLAAAKTAAGVARGSARSFPGLFFVKSKRGNLLLARREGKQLIPYFVLKQRVVVPARPFARPAMDKVRAELPARLGAAVRKAVGS